MDGKITAINRLKIFEKNESYSKSENQILAKIMWKHATELNIKVIPHLWFSSLFLLALQL